MEGNTKKELGDVLKKMDRLSKDVNLIEENISRLADKIEPILLPERPEKPSAIEASEKDAKESSQLSYRIDKIDSLLQVLNERLCDIIDRAET